MNDRTSVNTRNSLNTRPPDEFATTCRAGFECPRLSECLFFCGRWLARSVSVAVIYKSGAWASQQQVRAASAHAPRTLQQLLVASVNRVALVSCAM